MKPIKLTIQAFGPFVDKEEIDFSLLGNSPLFLINGPTGSGKSSILDAICFSLYGKTTGAERDAAQMRCDQADPKTLTEVTLDFSLGDKQYRVSRSPTQQRAKVKREGFTEHNGEANLWEIDSFGDTNLIVTKKLKEVTTEIENLTGLNVEQFRQVMVLPQGKFRELLNADSSDRKKIFSKLFQTSIYTRIEESLKNKAISINNDKKAHDNQIKGILDGADLSTEDEVQSNLDKELPEFKKAIKYKDSMSTSLQNQLNIKKTAETSLNQYAELEKTKTKLKQKEQLEPEIKEKKEALLNARNAEKITPLFKDLTRVSNEHQQIVVEINDSEQQSKQLKSNYEKANKELSQSKEEAKGADKLKQTVIELKQYKNKADKLEASKLKEKQSQASYKTSSDNLLNTRNKLDDKTKYKQTLEKTASEIQNKLTDLGQKQIELKQTEQQKQQLLKLDTKKTEYKKLIILQKNGQAELERLQKELESSISYAKQQELFWHTAQAAILAKELKEDEPCPVCGSLEHPKPISLTKNKQQIVTKEQVDIARAKMEDNRIVMQEASNGLNDVNSQIKQITQAIAELEKDLGDAVSDMLDDVIQKFEIIKADVALLEKSKIDLEGINNNIHECNKEVGKLNVAVSEMQVQDEADNIQFKLNQATVKQIEKELPEQYREKSKLQLAQQELEEKIINLTGSLEKAQLNFDESKTSVTKQETYLKGLVTRADELNKKSAEARSKWDKSIVSSPFTTEEQYKAAILTDDDQESLSNILSTYKDELIHIKGELEQQQKTLKDSSKPDLEQINILCDEKQTLFTAAENTWKELDARVNQLKTVKSKLKKAHEKSAMLEDEYAIYGTLSNVANGRTGNYISLQSFVLSILLDDVLIEASRRLNIMTKGRYQLLRKQDKSKGNKASGLDLDVEDSYTGKSRSVSTLSGGESFMAALALALGLSDVVQAYAGGIKLDTLFIDEGFGSLDQESLDLAIRTLIDLQATGRMIGIISHVSELKEQMSLRLDVISSKTGSTIKTIAA